MTMPTSVTVHFINVDGVDVEDRGPLFPSPLLAHIPRRDDEVQVDDLRYRVVDVVWQLFSDTDTAPEVEVHVKPIVDVQPWAM